MERIVTRASALGLIAGGLSVGAGIALNPFFDQRDLTHVLLFLGALALVMSLPAMYARQASAASWLGLVGHVLLMAGMVLFLLYAGGFLVDPYFHVVESLTAFLLGLAAIFGLLLTAIATVRAGVYPRWSGYLLLGASLAFFFSFIVAETLPSPAAVIGGYALPLLFAASFVSLGLALWRADAPAIAVAVAQRG
jgi:hypothetical protein